MMGLVVVDAELSNRAAAMIQRGPDIPCFLNIEKWIITKIRVTSGKTNV